MIQMNYNAPENEVLERYLTYGFVVFKPLAANGAPADVLFLSEKHTLRIWEHALAGIQPCLIEFRIPRVSNFLIRIMISVLSYRCADAKFGIECQIPPSLRRLQGHPIGVSQERQTCQESGHI
jgi:hypothetical protein